MQNYEDIIRRLTEQNTQLIEENHLLKQRLDIALHTIALQAEEIRCLKDEIAILKGQKPRPKIPPNSLEGQHRKDKPGDKGRMSRGKYPGNKKTNRLEIHNVTRVKPDSIPEEAIFKGVQKYTVQDIVLRSYNTIYELERWKLRKH